LIKSLGFAMKNVKLADTPDFVQRYSKVAP
jgi:hypothetical protein